MRNIHVLLFACRFLGCIHFLTFCKNTWKYSQKKISALSNLLSPPHCPITLFNKILQFLTKKLMYSGIAHTTCNSGMSLAIKLTALQEQDVLVGILLSVLLSVLYLFQVYSRRFFLWSSSILFTAPFSGYIRNLIWKTCVFYNSLPTLVFYFLINQRLNQIHFLCLFFFAFFCFRFFQNILVYEWICFVKALNYNTILSSVWLWVGVGLISSYIWSAWFQNAINAIQKINVFKYIKN